MHRVVRKAVDLQAAGQQGTREREKRFFGRERGGIREARIIEERDSIFLVKHSIC